MAFPSSETRGSRKVPSQSPISTELKSKSSGVGGGRSGNGSAVDSSNAAAVMAAGDALIASSIMAAATYVPETEVSFSRPGWNMFRCWCSARLRLASVSRLVGHSCRSYFTGFVLFSSGGVLFHYFKLKT